MKNKQQQCKELYTENPEITVKDLAMMVGCSLRTAKYGRHLAMKTNKKNKIKYTNEESGNERNIVTTSAEIRTLDELLEFSDVDLDEWEVIKHTTNSWGSARNENFQVKAWLKRKEDDLGIVDIIEEFAKASQEHSPLKYIPIKFNSNSGNAIEIAMHDLHFGSLCWGDETGSNYDIKIAKKIFLNAINYYIEITRMFNPELFIMPIGSDLFNVNSMLNETVAGTFQDEDCRWQKTFIYARKMLVLAIDMLRQVAPVKLFVIPGNHDEERAFYIGESLNSWYRECDNVEVDNSPTPRKYWKWGNGMLLMTHGSAEVRGQLPMIMATEEPIMWSQTKYREVHKGHLHSTGVKGYDFNTENQGVKERLIGSLAATDSWHKKKGYSGLRETNSFIWNKDKGIIADLPYHP